jgi:hypothetical protein
MMFLGDPRKARRHTNLANMALANLTARIAAPVMTSAASDDPAGGTRTAAQPEAAAPAMTRDPLIAITEDRAERTTSGDERTPL